MNGLGRCHAIYVHMPIFCLIFPVCVYINISVFPLYYVYVEHSIIQSWRR
jgi:hypothetical protein